jgi:type II secretory pathway pseudopilin PulG
MAINRKTGRPNDAFTRVELLVVLAVGIVLAALLVPALVRNKVNTVRLQCVSNLKQVAPAELTWRHDLDIGALH